MATMNISLPEAMKEWVEAQIQTGRYNNVSDYVRDLIRRDQDRADHLAKLQQLVAEGLNSGVSTRSVAELFRAARDEAASLSRGQDL